jgi:hypothetical protein
LLEDLYMKRSERLKKQAAEDIEKIRAITRHIRNVQDNCILLAERLAHNGEIDLARKLVANGMIHDASKFHGIEWQFMAPGVPCKEESAKLSLKMAISHHRLINPHHPEHWEKGVAGMPSVYLAEMVCDLKARSEEFGTDIRRYLHEDCLSRWGLKEDHEVFKKIMAYVDLLCETPFTKVS